MNKKKLFIIVGVALVAIIGIIIYFASSGNGGGTTAGAITSVVLAKGEDTNKQPINISDVFALSDPEIHSIVTYNSLPGGTSVEYQWVNLRDGTVIKDTKRTNGAVFTGNSTDSIIRDAQSPSGGEITWNLGDFEFRVLLNGTTAVTKSFKVVTDKEITQNKILTSIRDIQLTTAVGVDGKPSRSVSSTFSVNDPSIFASVSFENLPVKTEFDAKWTYIDEERQVARYQKSLVGGGVFAFDISAKDDSWLPTKKWPTGRYQLTISLNGELIKTINFTVQ